MLKINDQKMLQLVTLHILARTPVSISTAVLCKITNNPLHRINRMLSALRTSNPPLIKESGGGHVFVGNINELDPLPDDIKESMSKVDSFISSLSRSVAKQVSLQHHQEPIRSTVSNNALETEKNTSKEITDNKNKNVDNAIVDESSKNLELNFSSNEDQFSSCLSDLQIQILKLVAKENRSYIQTQLVRQLGVSEQEIIEATTPLVNNNLISKASMDVFSDAVYKGTDKTALFLKNNIPTEEEQRDIDNAYTVILSAIKEQKSISEANLIRIVMNTLPITNKNLIKRKIDSMVKKGIFYIDDSTDVIVYCEDKPVYITKQPLDINQIIPESKQTEFESQENTSVATDKESKKEFSESIDSKASKDQVRTDLQLNTEGNKALEAKDEAKIPYSEFNFDQIRKAVNNAFRNKVEAHIDNTKDIVNAINSISEYVSKLEEENKKWRRIALKIANEIEEEFNK